MESGDLHCTATAVGKPQYIDVLTFGDESTPGHICACGGSCAGIEAGDALTRVTRAWCLAYHPDMSLDAPDLIDYWLRVLSLFEDHVAWAAQTFFDWVQHLAPSVDRRSSGWLCKENHG